MDDMKKQKLSRQEYEKKLIHLTEYTDKATITSSNFFEGVIDTPERRQRSLDNTYLQMAEIWGQRSHAKRAKVGCLIVKNRAIISDGYNGTPAGFDNCCEFEDHANMEVYLCEDGSQRMGPKLITKPEVLHAESNALTKLARSTNSSEGATMYVTLSPCFECAKLIIQAGIKRVVYRERYRDTSGIELLHRAGIEVVEM